MSALGLLVTTVILAVVVIAIVWILFWWLYRRATKETAFVRTGLGGQKVVINGGAFVIPALHDVTDVNMNTLRLEVSQTEAQSLIARDRMRVDVSAEFYVRVRSDPAAIALAAQALGARTLRPESLRDLVAGRFVDALRSVAAEMTMEELHEQRGEYIARVKALVGDELANSGLELEAASLTALDQTKRDFFNPNNAFDAEGLTKLTGEIEDRRRKRNEIEQAAEVAIQQQNLDAETRKLDIAKEEEYARLRQEREIAVQRAEQTTAIASEEAARRQEAEQAEVTARRQVEIARVEADREVDAQRIEAEQAIEQQRLRKTREVEQSAIESELSVDMARIDQQRTLAVAEQQRQIAVAEHSRSESQALAEASEERVRAVQAEEAVVTVRDTEREERAKALALIAARRDAEKAALATVVAAETESKEAENLAQAAATRTQSEAARIREIATAEAEADTVLSKASELRGVIDAATRRALNEADNTLSPEQVAMKVKLAVVERLQDIIRESVKPMEQIDGIKILQVDGLTGASGSDGGANGSQNLAEQVVDSALRYRAQAPVVDALLAELGLSAGLAETIRQSVTPAAGGGDADGDEAV